MILIEPGPFATPIWAKAVTDLDDLLVAGHPEIGRYADRLRSLQDSLRAAARHGASSATVAETIHGALTTNRPRNRYAVGGGAKLVSALRPLVPQRLVDAIGRRTAA